MQQPKQTDSRKKFLLWSVITLSSFTFLKLITGKKKKQADSKNETVKMLTRDGKLVELDKHIIVSGGKKITDKELQQWIKK